MGAYATFMRPTGVTSSKFWRRAGPLYPALPYSWNMLWFVNSPCWALLTIIAIGLTAAQRTESALAGNQLATARFHAAAEAGIGWAVLNLLAPATAFDEGVEAWVPDGSARLWTFAGETLEITVFNEASRIDLNRASRDQLEALLQKVLAKEPNDRPVAKEVWAELLEILALQPEVPPPMPRAFPSTAFRKKHLTRSRRRWRRRKTRRILLPALTGTIQQLYPWTLWIRRPLI